MSFSLLTQTSSFLLIACSINNNCPILPFVCLLGGALIVNYLIEEKGRQRHGLIGTEH